MRTLVASLALAASLSAQSKVWVVDDDGGAGVDFTQIQAAVQAAAEGDLILVRAGAYARTWIDAKSLVVAADTGSFVGVSAGFMPPAPAIEVSGLGPAQSVTLRGLHAHGSFGQSKGAIWLHDDLGPVWLEQCSAQGVSGASGIGGKGLPGATIEACASVVVVDCTIRGGGGEDESAWSYPAGAGGPGLVQSSSTLRAFDVEIRGGAGGDITWAGGKPAGNGGPGLKCSGTKFFAAGGQIQGGAGGQGLAPPDCSGMGGVGIELQGYTTVEVLATELAGGPGGPPSAACPPGLGGIDFLGFGSLVFLPGKFRRLEIGSPLREGQAAEVRVHGFPGELAFVLVAAAPAGAIVTGVTGPLVVSPVLAVIALGALPEDGSAALPLVVGELGPGAQVAPLWLQAFYAGALGLALGEASAVALLDASF